jgi:hypothetical protein
MALENKSPKIDGGGGGGVFFFFFFFACPVSREFTT